jgi:hypothetical protein
MPRSVQARSLEGVHPSRGSALCLQSRRFLRLQHPFFGPEPPREPSDASPESSLTVTRACSRYWQHASVAEASLGSLSRRRRLGELAGRFCVCPISSAAVAAGGVMFTSTVDVFISRPLDEVFAFVTDVRNRPRPASKRPGNIARLGVLPAGAGADRPQERLALGRPQALSGCRVPG